MVDDLCLNDGACVEEPRSEFRCECSDGWSGARCESSGVGDGGGATTSCDSASQAARKPALLAFVASGNRNGLEGWDLAAGDPCVGGWAGVTCDSDAGVVVTQLELRYNGRSGLMGALSTLGGLVRLQVLDLNDQGSITSALFDLASMVGLTWTCPIVLSPAPCLTWPRWLG